LYHLNLYLTDISWTVFKIRYFFIDLCEWDND